MHHTPSNQPALHCLRYTSSLAGPKFVAFCLPDLTKKMQKILSIQCHQVPDVLQIQRTAREVFHAASPTPLRNNLTTVSVYLMNRSKDYQATSKLNEEFGQNRSGRCAKAKNANDTKDKVLETENLNNNHRHYLFLDLWRRPHLVSSGISAALISAAGTLSFPNFFGRQALQCL